MRFTYSLIILTLTGAAIASAMASAALPTAAYHAPGGYPLPPLASYPLVATLVVPPPPLRCAVLEWEGIGGMRTYCEGEPDATCFGTEIYIGSFIDCRDRCYPPDVTLPEAGADCVTCGGCSQGEPGRCDNCLYLDPQAEAPAHVGFRDCRHEKASAAGTTIGLILAFCPEGDPETGCHGPWVYVERGYCPPACVGGCGDPEAIEGRGQ